jgi:hypothetical protein
MDKFVRSETHEQIREPWNKGKVIGPRPPLRPKHFWAVRTRLQSTGRVRDLALFNLAIDSKLRGCDIVSLKVADVAPQGMPSIEHLSDSAKRGDQFASKSRSKHARQSTTISPNEVQRSAHISSLGVDQWRVT